MYKRRTRNWRRADQTHVKLRIDSVQDAEGRGLH